MTEPLSPEADVKKDRFWTGVFTGVFISCFVMTVLLFYLIWAQGVNVLINPKELAQIAQNNVQTAAAQEWPAFLEELKTDLPREIDPHLRGLTDLTINFGNGKIPIPAEFADALRKELNSLLAVAINNSLNQVNTGKYERKLGSHTYQLVFNLLNREIIGKTYFVKTNRWLRIPVKIVGSSQSKLRWRI